MGLFEIEATRFQTCKESFDCPALGVEFEGLSIGQGRRDCDAIIAFQAASAYPESATHEVDTPTAQRGFQGQMGKERRNMNIVVIASNRGIGANTARKVYTLTPKPVKPLMTDKFTVCGQTKDLLFGQHRKNTLHQRRAFCGGRIATLR